MNPKITFLDFDGEEFCPYCKEGTPEKRTLRTCIKEERLPAYQYASATTDTSVEVLPDHAGKGYVRVLITWGNSEKFWKAVDNFSAGEVK